MVLQDAKTLGLKFHARVQYDLYENLYDMRGRGEKVSFNRDMDWSFLQDQNNEASRIRELIASWHQDQVVQKEMELFKQKRRLAEAERTLEVRTTKKAQDDQRIASSKVKKLTEELRGHKNIKPERDSHSRIYPFSFTSMLTVNATGERVIMPARYHLRPCGQPESFDGKYNGCYNARRDNLGNPFWKPLFGKKHGILLVQRFYENVSPKEYLKKFDIAKDLKERKNLVLCFDPDQVEYMIIPTIWDQWGDGKEAFCSTALITDDPPEEVAATGHDRCPIFLKEKNIDGWLNPRDLTLKECYAILADRERPHYSHSVAA